MALRIIFYRKCLKCRFEDEEPLSVIFNETFSDRQFSMIPDQAIASLAKLYLEKYEINCPRCNNLASDLAIAIHGVENFSKDVKSSYVEDILKALAINPYRKSDFEECTVFDQGALNQALLYRKLSLSLDKNGKQYTLFATYMGHYYVFGGYSEMSCQNKKSPDYRSYFIEMVCEEKPEKRYLLFEQTVFSRWIKDCHKKDSVKYPVNILRQIPDLDAIVDL